MDVEIFKKRLPDRDGLTDVLDEVFKTARSNGLKIPSGDYGPETVKETAISRYTITLPVEGRYPQIKRFIYDIETMKYPLAIEEITLSRGKGAAGVIGLKIKMSAYFL